MKTLELSIAVVLGMLRQRLGTMKGNELVLNDAGRETLRKVVGSGSTKTVRVIIEGTKAQTLPEWTKEPAKARAVLLFQSTCQSREVRRGEDIVCQGKSLYPAVEPASRRAEIRDESLPSDWHLPGSKRTMESSCLRVRLKRPLPIWFRW